MRAITHLLIRGGRLMLRSLLPTTVVAVLWINICPNARGDMLYTTTVTDSDDWSEPGKLGPVNGEVDVSHEWAGDALVVPPYNASVPYAADAHAVSEFDVYTTQKGYIHVGRLALTGEVEGYDSINVTEVVKFRMSVDPIYGTTAPVTSVLEAPLSIPYTVQAVIDTASEPTTETYGVRTATSTATATGLVKLFDVQNKSSVGFYATTPLITATGGTANSYGPTPIGINTYPGDTVSVSLEGTITLGGVVWLAQNADGVWEFFTNQGAKAGVVIDPTFSFDQAAFDAECQADGIAPFTLADYYQFGFSSNIPPVPEPTTMLLLGSGLLGLAGLWKKRFFKK